MSLSTHTHMSSLEAFLSLGNGQILESFASTFLR